MNEAKSNVAKLIGAQAKLQDALEAVSSAESALTELFRQSILEEMNAIEVDGSWWDLTFDIDECKFGSLKKSKFKHFTSEEEN